MSTEKHTLLKILRWFAAAVVALIILVIAAIGIALWMLSPDELTPMVERYASDYLNASVKTKRVELTFWKSFPRLCVEIDSLAVISHSLNSLNPDERAMLPANADTLLKVDGFIGGINVMSLLVGNIRLHNVDIQHPQLNLVAYNNDVANYNIVPESTDDSPTSIPSLSINRFCISKGAPIRYFSATDSTDLTLQLNLVDVEGDEAPVYQLDIEGGGTAQLSQHFALPQMPFGLNGEVVWREKAPQSLTLRDFVISGGGLSLTLTSQLYFQDSLSVEGFDMRTKSMRVADIIGLLPEAYRSDFGTISTDVALNLTVKLLKPYRPAGSQLPIIDIDLDIPGGEISYDDVTLPRVKALIHASLRGDDLDASTLNVEQLTIGGTGAEFTLAGTMEQLFTDPVINGSFNGRLNLDMLPKALADQLPFTASGVIDGNADLRFRLSQLNPDDFHRVNGKGKLVINNLTFDMRDSSLMAFTPHGELLLDTDAQVSIDGASIDSLLTLKLNVDSIRVATSQGFSARGRKLNVVAATKNVATSTDSTMINPLGFAVSGQRIYLNSDNDSISVRMREASLKATLQRYRHNARQPHLSLAVGASRLRFRDASTSLSLSEGKVDLSVYPRERPQARRDSTAARRRTRTPDSVAEPLTEQMLDFGMDQSVKSWLRAWKATGSVSADRGRLFTPYVPVRNSLSNLNMKFSTDSIVIYDTRLKMGQSDFLINGRVTNIARALTSSHGAPLNCELDLQSDTINVNEITSILLAASAYSAQADTAKVVIADSDNDDAMQHSIDSASGGKAAPFIVPRNINASLNINANQLLYADIWFQRFNGRVDMRDGAINLSRLAGYTPMGSMDLTALYSSPTPDDLHFAAGLVVRKLNLRQFLNLLPEIDSIMPLLNEVEGFITADVAMTTQLDSLMDIKFHTLNLVMKLEGDSLVVIDSHTFRTLSKWLMFRHKDRNLIDHMQVELMIKDSRLDLFPFVFDLDRYKFGVSGFADGDLNYDYHVAVLKSPIPFKFGINIRGDRDHRKIRLGRARFNEDAISSSHQLTDTARINLVEEIEHVFKFGVRNSASANPRLHLPQVDNSEFSIADTLTHADSLIFIQGGAIEGPPVPPFPQGDNADSPKNDHKDHKKKSKRKK